ncbi:MAG TPA: cytochrome d ubiquinol oxidase subunit II [Candidatus Dormibacteraeota bacterium]|jgi:cytochrome d ubiquinol oxidase subunit II|nr:cytochrome d ubiquinol oxidase subunit II [Candidatus Dormibacteraeota bacterium]
MEATIVAGVLWLALTAYAVLAGADFGGGVWDALATGPRRAQQRAAVTEAMGPVWEANHVWLIFLIVGLFTAFPSAFADIARVLFIPFSLALAGIVLRGAAFAFHAHADEGSGSSRAWGVVFGVGSIVSPAFFGMAAGAVATGAIRVQGGRVVSDFYAWVSPLGIVLALLAVALCAYLAATFLMVEAREDPDLERDFQRRAMGAAVVSGALAIAALVIAGLDDRILWNELTGRGLPLLILALLNGPLALFAVRRVRPHLARLAVAAQMVFVLWAWAVGQYPYLVPPDLRIADAATAGPVLTAFLAIVVAGMLVMLPSLFLLFRVFKGAGGKATNS